MSTENICQQCGHYIEHILEIGSVVKLKSGSPEMTVQRFIGTSNEMANATADDVYKLKGFKNGDVVCQWFIDNLVKHEAFPKESLILIK